MRLRRKACVLRAIDTSPRPTALSGGLTSTSTTPANSPRYIMIKTITLKQFLQIINTGGGGYN